MILGVFLAEPTEGDHHRWPWISLSCPNCSTHSEPARGSTSSKKRSRLVCQELIEAELTAQIGAGRYERTETRTTERNGHRARVLSTKAGDVELAIPKLRKGSFFPSILEPRRRIDQALYAVVMEAYVHGVSTRAVDELVAALGVELGHLRVRGVADLCRARRGGRLVPGHGGSTTWPSPTCTWTPPTCTSGRTTR